MKKLDQNGFNLLAELEGIKLHPYPDTKGIWTIGVGNTCYENGTPVKKTDPKITLERAHELFAKIAPSFEKAVNESVTSVITQNQFNALFCFCWNVGINGFKGSQLLKIVNKEPNNSSMIEWGFFQWKGKNNILLSRRQKELKMYLKP